MLHQVAVATGRCRGHQNRWTAVKFDALYFQFLPWELDGFKERPACFKSISLANWEECNLRRAFLCVAH